ncbi:MAG: DNA polymerase I [Bacillota bacterium]
MRKRAVRSRYRLRSGIRKVAVKAQHGEEIRQQRSDMRVSLETNKANDLTVEKTVRIPSSTSTATAGNRRQEETGRQYNKRAAKVPDRPRRILLIDSNSLAHRAFHAIPPLSTREGLPTNAVFGFTSMLLKLLKEVRPDSVIAAFDKGKVTFRHELEATYKAHRPATPDDLRPQFPLIKEVLNALRIPVIEIDGFEADDIIGTLVTRAEAEGINSLIVTGDLDTLQFVSPKTSVLHTKKGISEIVTYDEEGVRERFGVEPGQLPDYKGLVGDASDNIAGVPGIGAKTAASLLSRHGSLEEVLARTADLPARIRNLLSQNAEQARRSKHLATMDRNVPLSADVNAGWPGPDNDAAREVFQRLEFRSLLKKLFELRPDPVVQNGHEPASAAVGKAELAPRVIGKCPEDLKDASLAAVSLQDDKHGTACALCTGADSVILAEGRDNTASVLRKVGSLKNLKLTTHDAKRALHLMAPHGIEPDRIIFDTMLAAYLLNPSVSNKLEEVAFEHAGIYFPDGGLSPAERALAVFLLTPTLEAKLRLQDQEYLFREVELPLAGVLKAMESAGVAVDRSELARMSAELGKRVETVSEEIFNIAGERFNLNSPRQLGAVLFEKIGLKPVKKTKTGPSTDASVLEKLADHQIVSKILLYRQLVKFKNTYTDALMRQIDPVTGRLHTTFFQAVTATGRLASAEPNLQNIPIRDPMGRRIRRAFIAGSPDSVILSADYSQIELRILAHLSEDPLLINAFSTGEDIHTRTAAEVFGVPPEAVTPEMRSRAKVVNFGIIYGMSDFGLAQELKIEPGEAHRYIQNYFGRYTAVKRFVNRIIGEARDKGFVTTVLNRYRYVPEILSPNRIQRQLGERLAVNTTIQGSAADLIKKAMVDIHRELCRQGCKSQMVLQVHDELLFEVPRSELSAIAPLVKDKMENALKFNVPITVTLKAGPNWHDVEKLMNS